MNEWIQALVSTSIMMGGVAVLYRLFLQRFEQSYKASWRYVIWCMILLGFLLILRPRIGFWELKDGYEPIQLETNMANEIQIGDKRIEAVLFAMWLVVSIIQGVYLIREYRQFSRIIKRFAKKKIPAIYETIFREEQDILQLEKNEVGIRIVSCIDAPMMMGYLHPYVCIPDMELSKEELRLIIRHELVHYKRRDVWWKAVMGMVHCVHWFNPIVYFMERWIDEACERACDEVILQEEDERGHFLYGTILLKMVRKQSGYENRLVTSFGEKKSSMQVRFAEIFHTGRKKSLIIGAIVLSLFILCSGTYRINGKSKEGALENIVETSTMVPFQEETTVYGGNNTQEMSAVQQTTVFYKE